MGKKKSVSKIAKGQMAKVLVLRGSKGAQGVEDYRLLCNQEGQPSLHKGKGVLQCVSAALCKCEDRWAQGEAPALGVGISAPVERRSPRLPPTAVADDGHDLSELY